MKVLVLGGTGFVGSAISKRLNEIQGVETIVGARSRKSIEEKQFVSIDATDTDSLRDAFSNVDVVVNCVTGSADTIRDNAAAIVNAAGGASTRARIIHMSSMAVYGDQRGVVDELAPLSEEGNWYAKAKIDAEQIVNRYADAGGSSTILRAGCVYGADSALWVDRIGLLLKGGRLGDLGVSGDGWSNLVHVDDVAEAVVLSLDSHESGTRIYNLSAPDSPRWNNYFRDFSLAIDCVPLKYKTRFSMLVESLVIAPPLAAVGRLSSRRQIKTPYIPSIPPSLLRLWRQQIRLDSSKIEDELEFTWKTYDEGLKDSVHYFRNRYG